MKKLYLKKIILHTLFLFTLRTNSAAVDDMNEQDEVHKHNISSVSLRKRSYEDHIKNLPWLDDPDIDKDAPGIRLYSPMLFPHMGVWGKWSICPKGTYASGFQIKHELKARDNSALNGIALFCLELNSNSFNNREPITSTVGPWGIWGNYFKCFNGVFTGFNLKQTRGLSTDMEGATNIKMKCSSPDHGWMTGDSTRSSGDYLSNNMCGKRQAICGIRTQIHQHPTDYDHIGLNNMGMLCCPLVDVNTKATDQWIPLRECDNQTNENLTCAYSFTRGVSMTSSSSSSVSRQKMETIGFSIGTAVPLLGIRLSADLEVSQTTGTEWSKISSKTYEESTTYETEFVVPPKTALSLEQVVGGCGDYRVGALRFRVKNSKKF